MGDDKTGFISFAGSLIHPLMCTLFYGALTSSHSPCPLIFWPHLLSAYGVGGPASISPPHKASSDVGLCTCCSFCLHTLLSPLHPPTSYSTSRSGLESSLHQQSFTRPPRLDEEPYNILQLFPSFPFTVLSQLVPECLHFCLIKSVSRF